MEKKWLKRLGIGIAIVALVVIVICAVRMLVLENVEDATMATAAVSFPVTEDQTALSVKEYEKEQEQAQETIIVTHLDDGLTQEQLVQQKFESNLGWAAKCNPTFAWVIDYEVNLGELNNLKREDGVVLDGEDDLYAAWESWNGQIYQLTRGVTISPADPIDYKDAKDNWGNPLWKTEEISSLYDLPKDKEVWLFNQNGFLWKGLLGYGDFEPGVELICAEDSLEALTWTPAEELTPITQATVTFTGVGSDWGFTSYFYTGREFTKAEIRHLYLMEGTSHWYNQGYIGGGSSSHGNFSFDKDGILSWNDYDYEGRTWETTNSFAVSELPFPVDTEIIVVTESYWMKDGFRSLRWTESQKFILQQCGEALCMLESGESAEEYLELLPGNISTESIHAQKEAYFLQHHGSSIAVDR